MTMVTWTRPQFDLTAKEWIKQPNLNRLDWKWCAHPLYDGFGYLKSKSIQRWIQKSPSCSISSTPVDLVEARDDAAILPECMDEERELCHVIYFICLSASFRVPVLHFTAHRFSGAPLSLDDILDSNIFPRSSSASDEYPFSTLDADAVVLPFLSQIDHPTTNEPTWFLHPCETQSVVDEILKETRRDDDFKLEAEHCREWWECWWMVVGTLIDLRE